MGLFSAPFVYGVDVCGGRDNLSSNFIDSQNKRNHA